MNDAPQASRVLVVDDDAATRRLLVGALACAGLEVVPASTALEGIRAAKARVPDVILLDLVLPGCSGESAARSIKDDPRFRDVPLILVSGHPELAGIAAAAGANDFLRKPFKPAELIRRVQRALEGARTA
jgi:CheY-like chemotaxis protein